MVLVWRVLYGLLDAKPVVKATSRILRGLAVLCRRPIDEGLLAMVERRFVVSGWPHQSPGWVNLHVSRFVRRVRREFNPGHQVGKVACPGRHAPLRIGFTGCFSGLLGFPLELFEACPSTVALYIFDMEFRGRLAPYLKSVARGYFYMSGVDKGVGLAQQVAPLADAINASDLDMLVNVNWRADGYELLDAVTTPCIVHHCSGSDLMHHEKIDVQLYPQPEADYLIRGSQLFCCTTERLSSFGHVRQIWGFYDRRGANASSVRPWNEREPLMVFHGSLRYLEGRAYLATVFDLLHEDKALQFIYMGKDNGTALKGVIEAAKQAGVEGQVHYEGHFSAVRGEDGDIPEVGWSKMLSYLQRARLAPDPWPMGGGSSRFEGYLAGTPSVHMGLRVDRASWRRRQHSVCEVPLLLVPSATATTIEEYRRLCRRCLYDERFADRIISEQLLVAKAASDPAAWWDELVKVYEEWHDDHVVRTPRSDLAASAAL